MRKIFQKWLFLFVLVAFAVTFSISFWAETKIANSSAVSLINLKIDDLKKQIHLNDVNVKKLRDEADAVALTKARSFAKMLALSPDLVLSSSAKLKEIAKILKVDEIDVIDEKGIITASTVEEYIGFDMAKSEQSREFLDILEDSELEIAQAPRPIGFDDSLIMQYAGVARQDGKKGIVQIALRPERLEEALKIADIKNIAPSFRIGQHGKMLIAKDATIISINDPYWVGKSLSEYGIPDLKSADDSSAKVFDAEIVGMNKKCVYDYYGDFLIVGCMPKEEIYISRNEMAIQIILFNFLLFGMIFVLISLLVQYVVINGIYRVNKSLAKITSGNLNEVVRVNTNKEFVLLSKGINSMVLSLKKAIAEAAARIDKELKFAKDIQYSALPSVFPPYPDKPQFDIFAKMEPAKEVGGDFYDFFLVDDNHLAVVIADVSGKGIPAALFMMTAKALIKNYTETGLSPAKVLEMANKELEQNNETGMFVTVFMGILDVQTGKFVYANAGHNPPLLRKKGEKARFLKVNAGFVLAALPNIVFKESSVTLAQGDVLYLYTDGVTEALDKSGNLFGNSRMIDCVNAMPDNILLDDMLLGVQKCINSFVKKAPQADDITMLVLRYNGKDTCACNVAKKGGGKPISDITVLADVENLHKVLQFVDDVLATKSCSDDVRKQIALAVEEIFVNIANYAYNPDIGYASLHCEINENPLQISLQFLDDGVPYNPLQKENPDLNVDLKDREVGGLGIFLIRQIMDKVDYQYKNGKNILTIKKVLS